MQPLSSNEAAPAAADPVTEPLALLPVSAADAALGDDEAVVAEELHAASSAPTATTPSRDAALRRAPRPRERGRLGSCGGWMGSTLEAGWRRGTESSWTGRALAGSEPAARTTEWPDRARPSLAVPNDVDRRSTHRWQVFGLPGAACAVEERPCRTSYWPSLPGRSVQCCTPPRWGDGGRSRSPLRGSPGFAPGSLLPRQVTDRMTGRTVGTDERTRARR